MASRLAPPALCAVPITALFTAAYTCLSDGGRGPLGGEPIRYTLWLFTLTALVMPLLMRWQSRTACAVA